MTCEGSGAPAVILESGTDVPALELRPLQNALADGFLVCAYDRAVTDHPRTVGDANNDLETLLSVAGVPGPYVLVGHSVGGELVQLYARTHANDVVAVVAMNSGPPCPAWLDGLGKLGNPGLLADETRICQGGGSGGERFDLIASAAEEAAAPAPPDIPFELMLSAADADWCPPDADPPEPFASQEQCQAAYEINTETAAAIVAAWPQGHITTIDAPHEIYRTTLAAVVALVRDVASRATAE